MIMTIKDKLYSLQDLDYLSFTSRLLPGDVNMIGVRLPILRKISKEVRLDELSYDTFEEIMLRGFVIGLNKNIDEVIKLTLDFLPHVDNWSICDSFVSSLKITRRESDKMFQFLLSIVDSKSEFTRRFVIVMFLWYYVNDEYIDRVIDVIFSINQEGYYVEMAIAWLIEVVFYFNNDLGFICLNKINNLSIRNKSIQKIKESNMYKKLDLEIKKKLGVL